MKKIIKNHVLSALLIFIVIGCDTKDISEEYEKTYVNEWWFNSNYGLGVEKKFSDINSLQKTFSIKKPKKSKYTVDSHELLIDLRNRKELPLFRSKHIPPSSTVRTVKISLTPVGDDQSEINFSHATNGLAIEPVNFEGYTWYRSNENINMPWLEFNKNNSLENYLTLKKPYFMSIPIKHSKEIQYSTIYYNGFQGDLQWMGIQLTTDTKKLKLIVRFNEDKKPFYYIAKMRDMPSHKSKEVDVNKVKNIRFGEFLVWEIDNAKKNQAYFIEWMW